MQIGCDAGGDSASFQLLYSLTRCQSCPLTVAMGKACNKYVPQTVFKGKLQRGGPEIATCPRMRSPWDRNVLWAQDFGTGPSGSRWSGASGAKDLSSARVGRFSCRVSAPIVGTCFPACLTKHPLLPLLRAPARPQGGGNTSECWASERR